MPIELKTASRTLSRGVTVALAASMVHGCASFPNMSVAPEYRPDVAMAGNPGDLIRGGTAPVVRSNNADIMQIPGVAAPARPAPTPPATAEQIAGLVPDEPINASLAPQPLGQYLRTVFVDVLKVGYSLGPEIGSRSTIITVNAPAGTSKRAYLALLQNTLRGYGLTMAIRNNAVLITEDGASSTVPGGQTPIIRSRDTSQTPTNGRAVQIFQLVALQASPDLVALAQRIAGGQQQAASLQIDAAANALAIEGQGRQVIMMVNILRSLDQPAYAGAQVARLEPIYQSPADFAANLQAALTAEGYIVSADPLGQKSVSILPLVSTNQTLVFAADKATMDRVQFWAAQIDAPSAMGSQASTFVYEVRNTSASQIGVMLASAGAQAAQATQARPGGGAAGGFPGAGGAAAALGQALRGGNATNNAAGRGGAAGGAARGGGIGQQQVGGGAAGGGGFGGGAAAGGAAAANRTTGTAARTTTQAVSGTSPTGGAITVDDAGNRILFTGSATQFAQLRGLLLKLDAPARQVIVEVTIAEVTMTDESRAGLEFFFNATANGGALSGGTGTFPAPAASFPGSGAGQAGTGLGLGTAGGILNFTNANGDLRAAFNAFASNNKVNILSRPYLPAKSGYPASIQVGVDVPIITSQRAAGTTTGGNTDTLQTVSYRPTGNLLTITPVVYGDDKVDLTISQEVSDVRETTNAAIDSPSFGSRVVNTTLTLSDGRSALLGGLIEDSYSKGNRGVPFLKDIPGVGQLFRTDSVSGRKTQLVVLITPIIIHSDDEMSNMVSQMTNEINSAFEVGRGASYTLTPYPLGGSIGIYPPSATVVGGALLRRADPNALQPAAMASDPAPIQTPAAPPPPPPPPPPPAAAR